MQALVIAKDALSDTTAYVDCVIGNQDIVHAVGDSSREMQERMTVTNEIFGANVAKLGAEEIQVISDAYVDGILQESIQNKNCLVLHTDSFASLQALFNRATPGQLKNVVILTYGSVNLSWAMNDQSNYRSFYDSLSASGAKVVQVDGFPFLGTRNKLNHNNSPLTFALLSHLDGPAGQKWTQVNTSAVENVREGHAGIVAEYIWRGMDETSGETKEQLLSHVADIAKLFGVDNFTEDNLYELPGILNQSLSGNDHDQLQNSLNQVSSLLVAILNENELDLNRPFNIYAGTSLKNQALIADQIPAIMFSELIEKRSNGLLKECLPMKFSGFNGRFAAYSVSDVQSALFYLDTKKKIEAISSGVNESELIDSYLKYIDLCMASALLRNEQMITLTNREHLLASVWQSQFNTLSEEVQTLGYDLPKSCVDILWSCSSFWEKFRTS